MTSAIDCSSLLDLGRASLKRVRRRMPADATPEERAAASEMDAITYKRWLDARRQARRRAQGKLPASPAALTVTDDADKREERHRLEAALSAWVNANKSSDRFARSLASPEAQAAVVTCRVAQERLQRRVGKAPTLAEVAAGLQGETGEAVSRPQAGRLLAKVAKLATPGGPWAAGEG